MWAEPDAMAAMMAQKIGHLKAGANTAWVPSPSAATLHALHYHMANVDDIQANMTVAISDRVEENCGLHRLLQPPLLEPERTLSREEILHELRNNVQGLLGYVVRWVQLGLGCSKVPDINGVGLMEDRATLRISSQHVANWLHHGLISMKDFITVLDEMMVIVNDQNKSSTVGFVPMTTSSLEYQAAKELVTEGRFSKNGYTEEILHKYRRMKKREGASSPAKL